MVENHEEALTLGGWDGGVGWGGSHKLCFMSGDYLLLLLRLETVCRRCFIVVGVFVTVVVVVVVTVVVVARTGFFLLAGSKQQGGVLIIGG